MTKSGETADLPIMGFFFSAFLSFLFGANTVAIKISLGGLGEFTNAGIRFGMAALIVLIWARLTDEPVRIRKGQLHQFIVLAAIFLVQLSLFYSGLNRTNASRGSLVVNVQPFFVLFLAHFFIPGDRITVRKLVGIALAFTGVSIVLVDPQAAAAGLRIGDLIVLAAAFLWACNGVYTKKVLAGLTPLQVVLYPTLFAAPLFFVEALLSGETMIGRIDTGVVLAVLYQALIATAFGFVAWNVMLRKYGAVAMHSFIFIMPVAGVLLGGWLLGEPITADLLLAMLLIATGILAVNWRSKKTLTIVHPGRSL
jgi:drug/metabolite transporter (DMT)-like permease